MSAFYFAAECRRAVMRCTPAFRARRQQWRVQEMRPIIHELDEIRVATICRTCYGVMRYATRLTRVAAFTQRYTDGIILRRVRV